MRKNKHTKRKALIVLTWEFVKLQLAGNVPFWGTYLLYLLFDKGLSMEKFHALLIATVIANALFFIIDDKWVFTSTKRKRKTTVEVMRFIIFMSISAVLVFNITWQLYVMFNISPYIGQFIAAGASTLWTFVGLRFWVFAPPRHHGLIPPKKPTTV